MKRMWVKDGLSPIQQAQWDQSWSGTESNVLMASICCTAHSISYRVVRRYFILYKSSLITPFPERFPLRLNQRWTGTLNKSTVDRDVCEREVEGQKENALCAFV